MLRCVAVSWLVLAVACGRISFDPIDPIDAPMDPSVDAPMAALAQQAYVKASNTGSLDGFGNSVALSADGSTLAVAASNERSAATGVGGNQADNSMVGAGAVYVFRRAGTTWTQEAYIKASDTASQDYFGVSVALSADGSTLAVGAHLAPNTSGEGAVYVFTRAGTSWSQEAYVKASNPGPNDFFGITVALSGDGATLAAGAPLEDSAATGTGGNQADETAPAAGAAYVFTRSGTIWTQQAYVKASNTQTLDSFGDSVALSADGATLAIAAHTEDGGATGVGGNQADNSTSDAGAVYVFTRGGTTWTQEAYVKASNPGSGDEFGRRLSLSADGATLAVAALAEDSAATGIGGNQADESAAGAGAVYVFTRAGTAWTQQAYVKASNTDAGDAFGDRSVALSADGSILAVGAPGEDCVSTGIDGNQADNSAQFAGAIYVFARAGTAWTQRDYVKASNTDASDQFGVSVALSADGLMLAVGAQGEASAATGLDGDQADNSTGNAGAVYLFQ